MRWRASPRCPTTNAVTWAHAGAPTSPTTSARRACSPRWSTSTITCWPKAARAKALRPYYEREAPAVGFEAVAGVEPDQRHRDGTEEEAQPAADGLVNVAIELESLLVAVDRVDEEGAPVGRVARRVRARSDRRKVAEPDRL